MIALHPAYKANEAWCWSMELDWSHGHLACPQDKQVPSQRYLFQIFLWYGGQTLAEEQRNLHYGIQMSQECVVVMRPVYLKYTKKSSVARNFLGCWIVAAQVHEHEAKEQAHSDAHPTPKTVK